ncbi:MAG: hypothetical protein AAGF98_07350 [Cyanobacteria bacterium P01_H01_bin.153]
MATRKPKGAVSIESYRGFLRLRWRLHGERYTVSLGLPDDAINQQIGYRQNALLTDSGVLFSSEIRLPVLRVPEVDALLQVIPFVDVGHGWNVSTPDPA